jgi:hypothetical protein
MDLPVEAFKKLSYPLGAIGKRPETSGNLPPSRSVFRFANAGNSSFSLSTF